VKVQEDIKHFMGSVGEGLMQIPKTVFEARFDVLTIK
jgi:hypothetical protein